MGVRSVCAWHYSGLPLEGMDWEDKNFVVFEAQCHVVRYG